MDTLTFKKKWENYWYYNKWWTIGGIFFLIVIIIGIRDCANAITPDITVAFMSESYVDEFSAQEFIREKYESMVPDINGDGKSIINPDIYYVNLNPTDQMEISLQQKIGVMFAAGEFDIYIMDQGYFDRYKDQGLFFPLDEFLEEYDIDESMLVTTKQSRLNDDGEEEEIEYIGAIKVDMAKFKTNTSLSADSQIYIGIKGINWRKTKERDILRYNTSRKLLYEFIK